MLAKAWVENWHLYMFIIHDRVVSQIEVTAVSSGVREFPQLLLALAMGAPTVK